MRDEWESTVQDEFFNRARHTFENGESEAERSAWIEGVIQSSQQNGFEVYPVKTSEGFEIGFMHEIDYLKYLAFCQKNAEGIWNHDCEAVFGERHNPEQWIAAANKLLDVFNVEYRQEIENGKGLYKFNRATDLAFFRTMMETETVNKMYDMIDRRADLNGIRREIEGQSPQF